MKNVVVVGGGITGLATAYFLGRRGAGRVAVTLVEEKPTMGGKIVSCREDGFVIEGGPDSFLTQKTAGLELARELGLGSELIGTNDAARKIFVFSRGRLHLLPEGVILIAPSRFIPFMMSSLISWPGKLRMAMDLFIPRRRNTADESLADFVRRRLGTEALDKIAEPLIGGIYVADAEDLSLASTFPRFIDMERKYGSVLMAMIRRRLSGEAGTRGRKAPPMFMTLKRGVQDLVDALVRRLDPASLRLGRRANALIPDGPGYRLALDDGTSLAADAVVLATPAYASADLLDPVDPGLAAALRGIRYVSTATVSIAFRQEELPRPLDGFGFVVPKSEHRRIFACSWSSTKFDLRAPAGHALLRAFIGGAQAGELVAKSGDELIQTTLDEFRAIMGIEARPVLAKAYRWPRGNPQYQVGHAEKVAGIRELARRHPALYLAGSAYHGVGIPDCIMDGNRVAGEIMGSMDHGDRSCR